MSALAALWAPLWALVRRAPTWLWGAAAALGALLLAYARGRSGGREAERSRANDEALARKAEVEQIARELEGLSESKLEERGGPWVRR
jgi:membrane protein implicated in regulation of membrane protease activity